MRGVPRIQRPSCTPRRGIGTWRGCSSRGSCLSLHLLNAACTAAEGQGQGQQPPPQQQEQQLSALVSSLFSSAAESTTPDALAKMEWLADLRSLCSFAGDNHAVLAASSGDVARLGWLRDRG